ncbi:hypothetical protein BHE74_00018931 [Ensete ventricosum]|nr:hypothetical protein BHE74_00018931 [Ensete ventricosum]
MDLDDLRGMPKLSGGKTSTACPAASTHGVDGVPLTEALKSSSKRSFDAPVPSDDPSQRHKKVKILSRRHKSHHDEGGSRSHSKGKEPTEPVEEPKMLVESVEEDASPIFHHPMSMKDLFKIKVQKDDVGYYALYMSDLAHQDPDKEMQARWGRLKNSTKVWNDPSTAEEFERGLLHPQLAWELYTLPSEVLLARAAKEMVLAWVRAQRMDDELLQSVKAPESARAELPRQAIDDYKESAGFKEGLKRMGRVTYEYDYRVALARFRSLHPDSEVEEDPFAVQPEDDLVPMERQQAFDDSDAPES